jgi:hypothetical protein
MIHTNNRRINEDMQKWYQPTIGNIKYPEGHKKEGRVNVAANIDRAQITGWKAIAEKDPYYIKNETEPLKEIKLQEVGTPNNYRTRSEQEIISLKSIPIKSIPIDAPEIPLTLAKVEVPEYVAPPLTPPGDD